MNSKQIKEFLTALDSIIKEKGIDKSIVIEAMEQAMVAAFKKKTGNPNGKCTVNPETREIRLCSFKTVVEEVNDDIIKIVKKIKKDEELNDFGRVAENNDKKVVVQRIKEAEKNNITEEFKDKQDELLVGILSREDANNYYVDLGRTHGILPKDEIIPGEKLEMGSSVKVYVSKLDIGTKGVFILLSRKHYGFLKRLLELEIPELSDGSVILYSVAREAGSRSKIAVYSEFSNIDPLGAIIGEKGSRINRVLKQINGEKIDIILYDKDPATFIANALSPAKNIEVRILDEKKKEALAIVDNDNFSLAIGKKGQNVKLASRLTHYKIDVKKAEDVEE